MKTQHLNLLTQPFPARWMAWVAWVLTSLAVHAAGPLKSVTIVSATPAGPVAQRASEILAREISERSSAKVGGASPAELTIELAVKPGIGTEGFVIAGGKESGITITGNDENGLLYGVGKFLHTSRFDAAGFTPSAWRGTEVPKGTLRGIYFATHFKNWYEAASDEERLRYVESLALWGLNALAVAYPDAWLAGFDDPKSQEWMRQFTTLFKQAKAVGMKVGTFGDNTGFTSTPKELLATHGHTCGGKILLCPSKPAAKQLMLKKWGDFLRAFTGVGMDFIIYWPYDEGGCDCPQCAPWGSNGYPKLCREFEAVQRSIFPRSQVILSTWLFDQGKNDENGRISIDFKKDGEYAGLDAYLAKDKGWVDYIMTDAHEKFPQYPLQVQVPGRLPMVNFPEISMIGQYPWGGFGANPLPDRFQEIWNQAKDKLVGGFPYSEGIYEDLNKVICAQLYWAPDRPVWEAVNTYIAYEYSPAVVAGVGKAISILERNHMRNLVVEKKAWADRDWFLENAVIGGSRIEFRTAERTALNDREKTQLRASVEEAVQLLEHAERQMTPKARASWRWRILYLRAVIDRELVRTEGWFEGPVLQAAFAELTRISHSEAGSTGIHVPRIDDANARHR